jgi:nicotinic acid mononucleotide adenylyltransferase
VLVDAPTAPVSSTSIRQRIADGQTVAGLVPAAVAAYIQAHGLYRARATDERT